LIAAITSDEKHQQQSVSPTLGRDFRNYANALTGGNCRLEPNPAPAGLPAAFTPTTQFAAKVKGASNSLTIRIRPIQSRYR
jgi:hypothetical protein